MSALPWERGRPFGSAQDRLARRASGAATAPLRPAALTLPRRQAGRGFWAAFLTGLTLGLLVGASTAQAQTGGTYDLTWNSVDGGGGTSTGGRYSLSGSAGQPDGSASGALSGGTYTLTGGYWAGAAAQYRLYLPLVVKTYAGGW